MSQPAEIRDRIADIGLFVAFLMDTGATLVNVHSMQERVQTAYRRGSTEREKLKELEQWEDQLSTLYAKSGRESPNARAATKAARGRLSQELSNPSTELIRWARDLRTSSLTVIKYAGRPLYRSAALCWVERNIAVARQLSQPSFDFRELLQYREENYDQYLPYLVSSWDFSGSRAEDTWIGWKRFPFAWQSIALYGDLVPDPFIESFLASWPAQQMARKYSEAYGAWADGHVEGAQSASRVPARVNKPTERLEPVPHTARAVAPSVSRPHATTVTGPPWRVQPWTPLNQPANTRSPFIDR
jgi:hypothetical protein